MLTEEILLSLNKVKRRGSNRWEAECPHGHHRNAKLGIMDTGEKTLLKCWAGCSIHDITASIGLTLSDLFHRDLTQEDREEKKKRHGYRELQHERLILQIAYNSKFLTQQDRNRANLAHKRLKEAGWLSTPTESLIETVGRMERSWRQ